MQQSKQDTVLHLLQLAECSKHFFFSKRKYETPKKNKLSPKQFIGFVLVMTAFAAIGLIISTVLASLIDLSSAAESVTSLTTGDNLFLKILTVGIVAPIGEELIFRKIVVDATHKYSEKFAIFFSGLLFSLFHGNFVQFFFTFLVGMLFAYVYTRTGNIFYSMALHMLMNLTTSVITANVMALNNDIIAGVWMLILFGLAIAGFVIFCIKVRRLKFEKHIDGKVSLGTILGAAFGNVFTIIFLIFTISLFVASMAPALFG